MTKSLIAVKCLHLLFQNWDRATEIDLCLSAKKKIANDIDYCLNRKLEYEKTKEDFNLSSALMSVFFMSLDEDSAEYVLQYACKKNANL